MKENRRKKREKERQERRSREGRGAGAGSREERKATREKVRRKRGKRTVVEKVWGRTRAERAPRGASVEGEVLARRPWVESKARKTTAKRKSVVRGVSSARGQHRRGRWRRKEARKRTEKGGRSLWKARTVERRAASGRAEGVSSSVKAQRDQRHKLAKQT